MTRSGKLSIHWQREILSKIKVIRERHWRLIAGVSVGMVLLCLAGVWSLPVGAASRTHRVMSTPGNVIWGEL